MRIYSLILGLLLPIFASADPEQVVGSAPEQVVGTAPQAAPQWTSFLFIAGIILFMWLFVFRPQAKRAKEQREFLASLKADMEVYTTGGIIGSITEVKDNIVVLNVGNSNIKVLRTSIAGKLEKQS